MNVQNVRSQGGDIHNHPQRMRVGREGGRKRGREGGIKGWKREREREGGGREEGEVKIR